MSKRVRYEEFEEIEDSPASNDSAEEPDIEVMKGWDKEMWIRFRIQNHSNRR